MNIRRGLFVLTISMTTGLFGQHTDRVKGAVIGAAVGDALGRVTEFIDTTDSIKKIYGQPGVTGFESFRPTDWVIHPINKQKMAPYTDDTVMAKIVFEVALESRYFSEDFFSGDFFIDTLAKQFIDLFGPHKYDVDPLFDVRAHGGTNASSCNTLALQLKKKTTTPWWWRGPQDYDTTYYKEVAREGGCGSVMRAWPLGLVFGHGELVQKYADDQSRLTHRHPMARAASSAIAVGTAYALEGASVDTVINGMIKAAERFDEAEKIYKPKAKKVDKKGGIETSLVAHDALLTSDMIRHAYQAAQSGKTPEHILGTTNQKQSNSRSPSGALLGWSADEAVAAAVYVFARHPNDLKAALQEAVNTPGDSDSIATLAGALVGANTGLRKLENSGFNYDPLENRTELLALVYKMYEEQGHVADTVKKKENISIPKTIRTNYNYLVGGALFLAAVICAYALYCAR